MPEQVNNQNSLVYFIAYSHSGSGKGNVEISLNEHPSHIDTLFTISKSIEEELNLRNVTIDNFVFLREEIGESEDPEGVVDEENNN